MRPTTTPESAPAGRPALLVWAAWTLVTALPPALAAWGAAQRGRFFPGVFVYQPDVYQYLSFIEQAARGALLLENKFDPRPIEPFFLNAEWLAVGWLAAALGGRLLLAFHVAGALAGGLLAAAATRVLRLAGLDGRQAAWGLALLLCGSGLGWLRALRGAWLPGVPDAYYCLYPWNQRLVGGPHALLGTGLLLLGLVQLTRWRSGRAGPAGWLITGTLLGLSRPFDMGLLLGCAAALWALDLARGAGLAGVLRQAAACAWLLPVAFYDYLAFRLHPSLGLYSSAQNTIPKPPLLELALAVGPALLLSAGHLRRDGVPAAFRPVREALLATAAIVLVVLALPLGFGVQFLNSLGALLLLLAATALPARALPIAVLALCPTSLWFFSLLSSTRPDGWPGPETRAALAYLERSCTPGDRLLAPDELSAYAAGLTPCRVVSGHWVLTPEAPRRWAEVAAFYAPQADPVARAAALEAWRPSLVLAPPGAGGPPSGHDLAWRQGGLEIWRRGP